MGDVFVGILFAMGLFLFSYKGYERIGDVAGYLARRLSVELATVTPNQYNSPSPQVPIQPPLRFSGWGDSNTRLQLIVSLEAEPLPAPAAGQ